MKKYHLLIAMAMVMTLGCNKESDEMQKPDNTPDTEEPASPSIKIDSQMQICQLDAKSTSAEIEFEVNGDWEIIFVTYDGKPVDWIKATPSKGGAGKHTVNLDVDPNMGTDDRLVRLEVRKPTEESRSYDIHDLVLSIEATYFGVSILQYGYYELVYGDPIEIKLDNELRIEAAINEYIANHNIDYTDIVYLEIFGPMYDVDYKFIREKLPNITVLDFTAADITTIPNGAFADKKSLHYIKLPFSVRVIDDYAFYNSGIKNVNLYLPLLLENIGWNAFSNTKISGTIFITHNMHLEGGAFEGAIHSVYICPGVSRINSDSVGPFGEGFIIYLPMTMNRVDPGIVEGATIVYCFAITPPKSDEDGLDNNIEALFIPEGTLDAYSNNKGKGPNYDSAWGKYYNENPAYNRMHEGLGCLWW